MGSKRGKGLYYSSEADKGRRRSNRGGRVGATVLLLFDIIFGIVTFAGSLALVLSLFANRVNSDSLSLFAFLGLVFPILYVSQIFCALYWAVRWRWIFFVPLVALVINIGHAGLYYRFNFTKVYDTQTTTRSDLSIMSFNVMGIDSRYDSPEGSCAERIAELINNSSVDVVCMQEFNRTDESTEIFKTTLGTMPYSRFRNMDPTQGERNGWGLTIYSAYPIVRSGVCNVDSMYVRSLWADIVVGRDTLRVVNNHLQTTSISQDDRQHTLTRRIITDTLRSEKIRGLLTKLSRNYRIRADQADLLSDFLHRSPYDLVVCGDFNDTPASYTYRKVRGDLTDAYIERGYGGDGTYKGFFNMFRIDYVMISDGLVVDSYTQSDVELSDHAPVLVKLSLNRRKF